MPTETQPERSSTPTDRSSPSAANPEIAGLLMERGSSTVRTTTADSPGARSIDTSMGSLYGTSFDPLGSPATRGPDAPAREPEETRGEPLSRGRTETRGDVHEVQPGDTIESIATTRLGDQSTTRERDTYARALRTINQLGPEGQPRSGESLKLPTRDANGNFVFQTDQHSMKFYQNGRIDTTVGDTTTQVYPDGRTIVTSPDGRIVVNPSEGTTTQIKDGITTTTRKDGSVTTMKADGTGTTSFPDKSVEHITPDTRTLIGPDGQMRRYERTYRDNSGKFTRTPDGNGGFEDKHTGDRPQHKFTLNESSDGSLRLTEAGGERSLTFRSDDSLSESRRALMEQATRSITEPGALSRFQADMIRFENRTAGMNATEIQDTYRAIGRLLTADTTAALPQAERTMLASQVMSQVATPSIIEQGSNNTCSVASLENVLSSTHPSRVAGLITDMATTGAYRASDGSVVRLSPENLRPLPESIGHPPQDTSRSYASQLFQLTAINAVLESNQTGTRYDQQRTNMLGGSGVAGSGERLIDTRTNQPVLDKDGKPIDNPNFFAADILKAYELVTGQRRPDLVLGHSAEHGAAGQQMNSFSSMEEFGQRLEAMKQAGRLPAILAVHSLHEPFRADSGGLGGGGGWHVVVISDYQNGMVSIDNQWGQRSDRQLSLKDTYAATRRF